jgi:hypothetical protein
MNALRRVKRFVACHQMLVRGIVAVLPLILAACMNGGGGSGGY